MEQTLRTAHTSVANGSRKRCERLTQALRVSFSFQRGCKLLGGNGDGASHELGDIVAL